MDMFLDIWIPRSFVTIWLFHMLSQQEAKNDVFLRVIKNILINRRDSNSLEAHSRFHV